MVMLVCSCQSGGKEETARTGHPVVLEQEREDTREEFVVFLYHRFGDTRYRSTNISLVDFRRQLEYLKEEQFEILTLGEALSTPVNPDRRRAVITVDDGYESFLTGAMPILDEFDFPVTLFVNTETVGGEDYLDWQQFRADVVRAQGLFEQHMGFQPELFAYPYGEYDSIMQRVVQDLGFQAAAAQHSGVILKGQDTWALPRFPMSDAYSDMESFKDKANARAFRVRYQSPTSTLIAPGSTPEWKLITQEELARGRMQCFVQGGFCRMDSFVDTLIVSSEGPLMSRRTLYTITMPDGGGRWYWRSHLWVQPE